MLKKFSEFRKYWCEERAIVELDAKNPGLKQLIELIAFENKQNDGKYHSTRHMIYVASIANWLLDQELYQSRTPDSNAASIPMIVACLMHDFKHSVGEKSDNENIEVACMNVPVILNRVFNPDPNTVKKIEHYIHLTEYPFKEENEPQTLLEAIIRDADLLYALTDNIAERTDILIKLQREIETGQSLRGIESTQEEKAAARIPSALSEAQKKFYSTCTMYTNVGSLIMEEFLNEQFI